MDIKINPDELRNLLNKAGYEGYGDPYEKRYSGLILKDFPKCEEFWRWFVVPLTKRIEGVDRQLNDNIRFREGIDEKLVNIASAHYSMSVHLAYAQIHSDLPLPSSLENFYTHLATACDLAETVIEKWYLLMLECRGEASNVLQELSKTEFLEKAGNWYDERYHSLYEYYLSRGKVPKFDFNVGKDLLKEYLGGSEVRKDYVRFSQNIRTFRNAIVHDVVIGKVIGKDEKTYIPKLERIGDYRKWGAVQTAADNEEILKKDFMEISQHLQTNIHGLKVRLNNLWEKVVEDIQSELFSEDRSAFRKKLNIEFVDTPGHFLVAFPESNAPLVNLPVQPSGVYNSDYLDSSNTAGSAVYMMPDNINPSFASEKDEG